MSGRVNLHASTVVANTGNAGGIVNGGYVQIVGTILAANRRPDGTFSECAYAPGVATFQYGFNIIGQDAGCPLFTTVDADPFSSSGTISPEQVFDILLGPLADNGGPTQTHALLPGSLAIDAENPTCPATDQRGHPRPIDGDGFAGVRCEIGSVEQQTLLQRPPAAITSVTPASALAGGAALTLTVNGTGFAAGSTLYWNGAPRTTYVASPTRLAATIPASDRMSPAEILTVPITVVNPGAGASNPLAFTITSPRVITVQAQIAPPGSAATASNAPVIATLHGVSATLTNHDPNSGPATVTVASYSAHPAGGTLFAAGGFFDVQVTGADASDSLAARFYYASNITATAEASLQLQYWTGAAWAPVIGSAGAAPEKDPTNNLDGTFSGGRFFVTLDATSTPRITELSGTIFALVEAHDSTPPTTAIGQSPAATTHGWHNTDVSVTLSATDDASGVAVTEFDLDHSGWTVYSGPIVIRHEGIHTLRWRSRDAAGNTEAAQKTTVRIDRGPPLLLVHATPGILWPANRRLVDVSIWRATFDLWSGTAGFTLVSVVSDEPSTTADDLQGWTIGTADTRGVLRAERSGTHAGRTYTLTYRATDRAGNSTLATTKVYVPSRLH